MNEWEKLKMIFRLQEGKETLVKEYSSNDGEKRNISQMNAK